ncbi:MAG: ubiquitin family protein [Candidatus Geothermincolia bacterium]
MAEKSNVLVELFGPFREYGKAVELEVDDELSLDEFLYRLTEKLGADFAGRAASFRNTIIHNRTVVDREREGELTISSGDRVAFGLLLGGG